MPKLPFRQKFCYSLFLVCIFSLVGVSNLLAQSSEVLLSGEPLEGELTEDALEMHYSFEAQAGDRISASLGSRSFDAYLSIENADGDELTSNDDSEGSLNSRIDDFTLEESGDYTLIVSSSDGEGTGNFTLTVSAITLQTIEFGETVTGELTPSSPNQLLQFEGKKGDVISISMKSDNVDSNLILSTDYESTSDDNSGGGQNALIGGYVLPETGTYTIEATTYSYQPQGTFTLTLDKVEVTPLAYDEPITASIDNDYLYYSFEGKAGDKITVRLQSDGTLDTLMSLKTQAGYYLAWDDDSGLGYDPEVTGIILSVDGVNTITIAPSTKDVSGEFTLSISSTPPLELTCDSQQTLEFNQKNSQVPYQIEVKANQTISLSFKLLNSNDISSLSINATENGEYIASGYGVYGETEFDLDIDAPYTGIMQISISDYQYNPHTYQLDVACS